MTKIQEGSLEFTFPTEWNAQKYDHWTFYRKSFQKIVPGTTAVDIVASSSDAEQTLWAIEIKDFRNSPRSKPRELTEEVACKVRDTLSGLAAARVHANVDEERTLAARAMRARAIRVVLHLEQRHVRSKLNPTKFDLADLQQMLRQRVHCVDAHALVVDSTTTGRLAWTVTSR